MYRLQVLIYENLQENDRQYHSHNDKRDIDQDFLANFFLVLWTVRYNRTNNTKEKSGWSGRISGGVTYTICLCYQDPYWDHQI